MTETNHNTLSKDDVLALRGLRLPAVALRRIQRAGIYCRPAISIEFQKGAGLYVIRGVESGGAVAAIGAYCGFVRSNGAPLTTLQAVNAIGANGLHVAVLSPALVRVQMFRAGTTYELLVTNHQLVSREGKGRPALRNSILFHGRHGRLEQELWGKDSRLRGIVSPMFYSRSGEQTCAPDEYHDAIVRTTAAACCVGCRHSHLAQFDSLRESNGALDKFSES